MAAQNGIWTFENIVGKSPAILSVIDFSRRIAPSCANVLIAGESGTGKEIIAKAIHQASGRAKGPFVAINCSAIPEALLESELFGHAKGSFTGAFEKKLGLFEEAEGGTLFLDEIGDLTMPMQVKLLRVLQERKIKRVGENAEREINVRVLAATHKDLRNEIRQELFREDLYFRLNVIQIRIPPLRERKEDILPLAEHFLEKYAAVNPCVAKAFSPTAIEYLHSYSWTGNVRELENAVERAVILAQGGLIEPRDLYQTEEPASAPADAKGNAKSGSREQFVINFPEGRLLSLEETARLYVSYVLSRVGGVKEQATRILDIDRKTLYRKLSHIDQAEVMDSIPLANGRTAAPASASHVGQIN